MTDLTPTTVTAFLDDPAQRAIMDRVMADPRRGRKRCDEAREELETAIKRLRLWPDQETDRVLGAVAALEGK